MRNIVVDCVKVPYLVADPDTCGESDIKGSDKARPDSVKCCP